MTKKELRTFYKKQRSELTSEQKSSAITSITECVLPLLTNDDVVHVFLPIERLHELDTYHLISRIKSAYPKLTLVSSISDFDTLEMPCYTLDVSKLQNNEYNIPEPAEPLTPVDSKLITVVLVPLLISDTTGYRVGYGKGFYDRFLSTLSSDCKIIGLNYFEPQEITFEHSPFDIPLDRHVSPNGITIFKK